MSEKFFEDVLALIEGPRDQKYGDSTENHARIAAMWSVLLNKKIIVQEVYLCLIAIKLSRLTRSPHHRDSWLDIAGYSALAEKE